MFDKTQDLVNVFPKPTSVAAVRAVCSVKSRMSLQGRAASGEPLDSIRVRPSTMADVDRELRRWYEIVDGPGPDTLPLSMAVLQQRAREIGERLDKSGFSASTEFVRRRATRHNLVNSSLWGTGGSAATYAAAAQERMAQIREDLSASEPDQIYNMDETDLFFRCLPNRAYVTAGRRRRVRGTKTMKAKDRVTLVLACNATGTHKIPVTIIGTAQVPVCFKPLPAACSLPYVNQKSAWMDANVYKKLSITVFVPAVRARTSLPVALVVDNCGAHSKLEHPQVATIPLPPNVTSVHQPLDAGIIAALKCRYKRRLLAFVVEAFERTRVTQLADAHVRQSASIGGPSAAGAPATGTGVITRAPEGVVMEASRPTESATDGQVGGWGLTGPPDNRTATKENAGGGVTVIFQPHCEESGEATFASVLGCARLVQSSSVAAAAGTTMVKSGARAPARDDWATDNPPRLPARAVGVAALIPLVSADKQASASAGFFGACAIVLAAPDPTGEPRVYVAPVVPSVPAHLPLRLPNVWVEAPRTEALASAGPRRRARRRRAAEPCPVRGVRDGGEAHLQDVAELDGEEWQDMEPATMAHCWVKARILPPEIEARLVSQQGYYRNSLRAVSDEAAKRIVRLQSCALGGTCFGDAPPVERQVAVETWLDLESDPEAILDTADAGFSEGQSSSSDAMDTGSDYDGDEQ